MRILLVSHDFLPNHPSGTEVYTWQLGVRLRERGHEVHVFTTEKDVSRPNLRLDRRTWDGLPVHELVNNLFYGDFRETWDFPPAQRAFGALLDELRPDVVHVMHLLYLSVGCVEEAAQRGIPVFHTLHDYWLQCARFGQRIHADGSICHVIEHARCGGCLVSFKFAQTPLQRRMARVVAGVRSVSGLDLSGPLRRTAARFERSAPAGAPAPDAARAAALASAVQEREQGLRRRLVPLVERFFAPSRFLRERFLEWGIPAERLEHLSYGLDLEPFAGFRRAPSALVRVAFLGTLAPHKAPHLLLEAWGLLPAELRARGRLTIHGPKQHHPEYVARLERLAAEVGAVLAGRLEREDVAAALAEVDLLVVPSVWYENSPLTIHEAMATRTPLLVSDLGGMAELVEPDGCDRGCGWRFRPGDPQDLARHLELVLREPARLGRLYAREVVLKDMRASAAELEQRYAAALEARARPAGRA